MIIDAVVIIALVIAIWIGYQRGVVQPLLVEICFVGTLLVILRDRDAYMSAMAHFLHANAVLAVFLALIVAVVAGFAGGQVGAMVHRMPVVRGVDGFLGVFVHAAFVIVLSYLLLSALVTLDKAFAPTVSAASITTKQASALAAQIKSNAITSSLVDPKDLAKLQASSRQPGGARIETVPQLDQLQTFYEQFVQPQLAGSRTAPYIMGFGRRIPIIGHAGPKDLPVRAATPKPSPKPSPTQ